MLEAVSQPDQAAAAHGQPRGRAGAEEVQVLGLRQGFQVQASSQGKLFRPDQVSTFEATRVLHVSYVVFNGSFSSGTRAHPHGREAVPLQALRKEVLALGLLLLAHDEQKVPGE